MADEPILPTEPEESQTASDVLPGPSTRIGPAPPPAGSTRVQQVSGSGAATRRIRIPHYGYEKRGDPDYDENSANAIGDRQNQMTPGYSVALNQNERLSRFGRTGKSTGIEFEFGGRKFRDDDTNPSEQGHYLEIFDPENKGTGFPDWMTGSGAALSAGVGGPSPVSTAKTAPATAAAAGAIPKPQLASGIVGMTPPPEASTRLGPAGAVKVNPLSEEEIAQQEADAATDTVVTAKKTDAAKAQAAFELANNNILTAHSTAISPEDHRVTLRLNPDTGSQRITGSYFIQGDPVHTRLLQGVPQNDLAKLPALSTAIARGDPFSFHYYSAPEEAGPSAGARPTAESRAYEQAVSTAAQRAAGAEGQLQRATIIPQRLVVAKPEVDKARRVMLEGFASDAAMNNTEHLIKAANSASIPIPYENSGLPFQRDLAGYIQNQIHGYKGDGSGPIVDAQGQPTVAYQAELNKPPGQQYIPHLLQREQAEFVHASMNIFQKGQPAATEFGEKAKQLAQTNRNYIGQYEGINRLRESLDRHMPDVGIRNRKGEVTRRVPWSQGTLEPTYRAYRLEHIRDVLPPIGMQSIRQIAEPHVIMKAPIALHTAAEFTKRAKQATRPAGGTENPEIGSFTKTPASMPETDPGLLSRRNVPAAPLHTPESAAAFNPRTMGESYPGNVPTPPAPVPPTQPVSAVPTEPTELPAQESIRSAKKSALPPDISQPEIVRRETEQVGQEVAAPPEGREFVSPNIKEGLNYQGASRALKGKGHANARDFHQRVEQALATAHNTEPAEVHDAIGDWIDGAENSTATSWKDQPWEIRRQAAALKGLHSAQKNVIAFEYQPEGEHSLYTLRFPSENPKKVRDALTENGIQFRTIEPAGKGTTVHVVDTDGGARSGIEKLIKGGHIEPGNVEERSGHAEFLGDPEGASREEAARNYRGVLQAARDQASQGQGGQGAAVPWFEGLDQEAEQNYRDLSQTRDIRGPLEEADLRAAQADRQNLTPQERAKLERTRKVAQRYVKKNPDVDPLSAQHFIGGHEEFPEEVSTKEDIAKFFGQRNQRLDYSKPADRQKAVEALTHDVMHAIAGGSEAPDWYDRTVDRSLRKVAEIAPDILTNADHAMAYKLATAITSQGQDVFPNFESGYLAYRHWVQTGEFPTDASIFGGGSKNTAMIENFQKVNRLWQEHGTEGFRKILETPRTMRQLRDEYGVKPGGESLDHVMEGAAMLGPKIGSFYNNLNKRFHTITFDLWASRTMNRVAGDMFKFSDEAMRKDSADRDSHLTQFKSLLDSGAFDSLPPANLKRMRAEVAKLEAVPEGKMTREKALRLAPTIAQWAEQTHKTYAKGTGGRSYPEELKAPHTSLAKNVDLNFRDLADAPRNANERQQWRQVYNELKDNLADNGLKLTHADLQAVLWYAEQKLFQTAGSRNRGSFDYLDAAHRLVRKVKSGQLPTLASPSAQLLPAAA